MNRVKKSEMSLMKWLVFGFALMMIMSPDLMASNTGSGSVLKNMPWDKGLGSILQTFSGPVAMAITAIALVGAGGMLIFAGQEMNSVVKSIVMIILAGAIMSGSVTIAKAFMSDTGAVISNVGHISQQKTTIGI